MGKIALLEAISITGSITAAAQSMNMSRMTAWLLVEEINKLLREPAVTTESGGAGGGGRAILTPVGQKLIQNTTLSKCAHEPPRAGRFRLFVGWYATERQPVSLVRWVCHIAKTAWGFIPGMVGIWPLEAGSRRSLIQW